MEAKIGMWLQSSTTQMQIHQLGPFQICIVPNSTIVYSNFQNGIFKKRRKTKLKPL